MSGVLHPKCGRRFPDGERTGHCGACCETFYGLAAFDQHLVRVDHRVTIKKEIPASADRDSLDALLKLDSGLIVTGLPNGIQAAYTFAPEAWRTECESVIHELAATGQVFTVDSLRRHGVEEPDSHVRWGSVFAAMKKRGVIEQVGVQLHQASRGGISAIREWRGVVQVSP